MHRLTLHLRQNAVAYLALFVALGGTSYAATKITGLQIADGTIGSADIRDGDLRARDIRKGTLRADLFASGALPNGPTGATGASGPQGPKGDQGVQGVAGSAGPSFGESKALPNKNDIGCNTENVVGEQSIVLTKTSRILAFGNGSIRDGDAPTAEYAVWLRLRNAADTQTLAISHAAWDYDNSAPTAVDVVMPLSVTGILLSGTFPEVFGATYAAQPGTYRLQLVAWAGATATACTTPLPDFGFNQGSGMGYALIGNG